MCFGKTKFILKYNFLDKTGLVQFYILLTFNQHFLTAILIIIPQIFILAGLVVLATAVEGMAFQNSDDLSEEDDITNSEEEEDNAVDDDDNDDDGKEDEDEDDDDDENNTLLRLH